MNLDRCTDRARGLIGDARNAALGAGQQLQKPLSDMILNEAIKHRESVL